MKSRLYTKTGDKGETSLVGGSRLSKSDHQIDLYGEVDHLNALVGSAISVLDIDSLNQFLYQIQNVLFDFGSLLACESDKRERFQLKKIEPSFIISIEKEIDQMDGALPLLRNFILPGGHLGASFLHQCRTQTRKVERKLVTMLTADPALVPQHSVEFVNRLSDYFFVASRFVNLKKGEAEIIWKSKP